MARRKHKGNEEYGSHANGPRYPGSSENFNHGKIACQDFPQGQKKESQIHYRGQGTDIGGIGAHSESEECNDIARQKLPWKGIKNIK